MHSHSRSFLLTISFDKAMFTSLQNRKGVWPARSVDTPKICTNWDACTCRWVPSPTASWLTSFSYPLKLLNSRDSKWKEQLKWNNSAWDCITWVFPRGHWRGRNAVESQCSLHSQSIASESAELHTILSQTMSVEATLFQGQKFRKVVHGWGVSHFILLPSVLTWLFIPRS